MNWHDIRLLLLLELRGALRERNIILYTVLVPALLYPLLVWMTMSVAAFLMGQSERAPSRVAVVNLPAQHAELEARLRRNPAYDLRPVPGDGDQALRDGQLDGLFRVRDDKVQIAYDGARANSILARNRLLDSLADYRDLKLEQLAVSRGVPVSKMQLFWTSQANLATPDDVGRSLLGVLLPFTLIVILSLGGMYPAIDATAGERERGTWETSLTLATPRINLVAAKYLYVSIMALTAGMLNLAAMTLSLRAIVEPMSAEMADSMTLALSFQAFLVVVAGTVVLSLLMSAAMMLVASFAQTFREGQSLVTPLFLLMLLPISFVMDRSLEFDTNSALIPVVNVALLWREAIRGHVNGELAAITCLTGLLCIAGCLIAAQLIMSSEGAQLQGPRLPFGRKKELS